MKIAIIGCGYLGSALAQYWAKKGHFITAATRSAALLKKLETAFQKRTLIDCNDLERLYALLEENKLVALCPFAERSEEYESDYLKLAQTLKQAAIALGEERTLFYASSHLVYGNHLGQWVDEEAPLLAADKETLIQIETEETLLSLTEQNYRIAVIRLANLYGPGEELWRKLEKLNEFVLPGSGENYTNTIHVEDAVRAIDYLSSRNLYGIYNMADDDHSSQKAQIERICQKKQLPKIEWDKNRFVLKNNNLRVSNHKIKSTGFTFLHPHFEV